MSTETKSESRRFEMPLLGQLGSYDRGWFPADLAAAVTVWAIVVPESMAYASIAGMPPQAGLYAASLPLIVYALFGTSRRMTWGPTAATAALSAATVAPLASGDMDLFIVMSSALAVAAGILLILGGLAKLGVIAEFLSEPVLTGFITGVALTMIVGQLEKILEVEIDAEGFFAEIGALLGELGEANLTAIAMGVVAFALLWALHKWLPKVPAALAVVVLAILAVEVLALQDSIHIVGEIPAGFPRFDWPGVSLQQWGGLLAGAAGVAVVIYGETMALSKAFAKPYREKVDANQELVASGVSNVVGGLFGSFVTAGSNSRTAAAAKSGMETQVSSLVVGGMVLLTALFLTPLFTSLPETVLGAIVIHAVLGLVKTEELRKLWVRNRADFTAAVATLIGVLTLDVLAGLVVGLLVSIAMIMGRAAKPYVASLAYDPESGRYRDLARFDADAEPQIAEGIAILRFDASLFFANASALIDSVASAADADPPPRGIVLDAEAITEIDTTAADAIQEILDDLEERGVAFAVVRLHAKPAGDLARCDVDVTPHLHNTIADAVEALTSS